MARKTRRIAAIIFLLSSIFICLTTSACSRRPIGGDFDSRTQCDANLKKISSAMMEYCDVYGVYPPAYTVDAAGKPLQSWRVLLLPFLDEAELYRQIRLDEPWDSEENAKFSERTPEIYRCDAADLAPGFTNYSVITGAGTAFASTVGVGEKISEITDGTSNTLLVVERKKAVCWLNPTEEITIDDLQNAFDPAAEDGLSGAHRGGANVVFFDGVVSFLPEAIDAATLQAFATTSGGEYVEISR